MVLAASVAARKTWAPEGQLKSFPCLADLPDLLYIWPHLVPSYR